MAGDVVFLHEVLPCSPTAPTASRWPSSQGFLLPVIARANSVLQTRGNDRVADTRGVADDLPLFAVPRAPPPRPPRRSRPKADLGPKCTASDELSPRERLRRCMLEAKLPKTSEHRTRMNSAKSGQAITTRPGFRFAPAWLHGHTCQSFDPIRIASSDFTLNDAACGSSTDFAKPIRQTGSWARTLVRTASPRCRLA